MAIFGGGWLRGAAHVQAKWDAKSQRQAVADAAAAKRQAEVTVKVVTKYVDRVRVVQGKTKTIIKEVPVYVTKKADADCTINAGFVRLHDAAASAADPGAARDADAAPSGVTLSAVAETVAGNYGICFETAEQLRALQSWAREVSKQ